MKVNLKTVFAAVAAAAVLVGCAEGVDAVLQCGVDENADGVMSVRMIYEDVPTKAQADDYALALDEEKSVKKVSVLVFDKSTGMLNASKELASVSQECKMNLPVGDKIVYALVNGPAVGSITRLEQFRALIDNLALNNVSNDGFTLVGSADCKVESGKTAEPTIAVKWLVTRIVLDKITCKIAPQYGNMTVDCVYLGNANTVQTLSGSVSDMVNPDGYADASKTRPIGKNGEKGACPDYLYRNVGTTISVGQNASSPYYMYCHPNASTTYTCLYVVATIGGEKYYYRVPLKSTLKANYSYSVEITIANLGSPVPPTGDYQNGAIQAVISIGGWTVGNSFEAEF